MSDLDMLKTNLDDDDAICMRTRARQSLASFTLDELEAFLHESDADDDAQNVDDEEEYRKFLSAVLQEDEGGEESAKGFENADNEDEENDIDFQMEIEQALESGPDDETTKVTDIINRQNPSGRRPETRQNKRQKTAAHNENLEFCRPKRHLRPLLPNMSNVQIAPSPILDRRCRVPDNDSQCKPMFCSAGVSNGFTAEQVGELYSLIHDHVQLLIQVFSLCVLEPSRQHIASQMEGLISELVGKRKQALLHENISPYNLQNVPTSTSVEFPTQYPETHCFDSAEALDVHHGFYPEDRNKHHTDYDGCLGKYTANSNINGDLSCFGSIHRGSSWFPGTRGPINSVLDVAPLDFVEMYIDDVRQVKGRHQKQHVDGTCIINNEREPLFPSPHISSVPGLNKKNPNGHNSSNDGGRCSSNGQQRKKTLSASLVESTKKQSVAPVSKDLVKLAQRFVPLFNPSLYPYKPPPAPVANRVLFTDAEDQLLALGLMDFNTDWKAIQQRFLPCKSKHQIFVRQKNRCSSKAPDNPIKAVRMMKTSPLSADEIARIHEGLQIFKLDWMSIWKFVVPYRDPTLLPRQWRIALGTQKSYKTDSAKKEKRRIYESKRRKCRAMDLTWKNDLRTEGSIIERLDECTTTEDFLDNEDESYVHEAFLSDWRPINCTIPENSNEINFSVSPCPDRPNGFSSDALSGSHNRLQNIDHSRPHRRNPLFYLRPYRVRRKNNIQLVKLAPGLPPVNLPSSVRIISQSNFKTPQNKMANKPPTSDSVNCSKETESISQKPTYASDILIHPLLYKATDCGNLMPDNIFNDGTEMPLISPPGNPSQISCGIRRSSLPVRATPGFSEKCSDDKSAPPISACVFHPLLEKLQESNDGSANDEAVDLEERGINEQIPPSNATSFDNFRPGFHESDARDDDLSIPGIVMEEEELSDSDVTLEVEQGGGLSDSGDTGENVQFECEEMDDSEGD